jgi:TetR/AcrR family transcriptional repressor of nem operon
VTRQLTARGQQTRARILIATGALIRERGIAAVTLEHVESAAGVGRGQLYYYFEDRDELLRAAVEATVERVLGRQPASFNGLADINDWFADVVAVLSQLGTAGGCPLGSLVGQLTETNEPIRAILAAAFTRWEAPLLSCLKELHAGGLLRPDASPPELADLTMAALQGGLLLAQVRRDPQQLHRALLGPRVALAAATAS